MLGTTFIVRVNKFNPLFVWKKPKECASNVQICGISLKCIQKIYAFKYSSRKWRPVIGFSAL